jgi:hypothetical protein
MKIRIMTEVKIECEPPEYVYRIWNCKDEQDRLSKIQSHMEDWVKEFHEFIKDHRSQDPVNLSVVPVYKNICEHCGNEWETDDSGNPICCEEAIEEATCQTKQP